MPENQEVTAQAEVKPEQSTVSGSEGQEPLTKKASDFRSIYVNSALFSISAFDFSFVFGELEGLDENNRLVIEQKIKVIMSPLHTKIFALSLLQNIQNYEKQFGVVRVPKGAVQTVQQSVGEPPPPEP